MIEYLEEGGFNITKNKELIDSMFERAHDYVKFK